LVLEVGSAVVKSRRDSVGLEMSEQATSRHLEDSIGNGRAPTKWCLPSLCRIEKEAKERLTVDKGARSPGDTFNASWTAKEKLSCRSAKADKSSCRVQNVF
jgi:hypothetical protein